MCGICGMIGVPDEALLGRMMEALKHRGPDGEGTYVDDHAGLGHRRLAVIDPEGSPQPIASEDQRRHLIANGEIYNYRALRDELSARGHRFRTNGDSEVILHLYEELGPDCTTKLDGMFAFAVWDRDERRLFLARDRLGIKPLLYSQVGETFLFASELKALLAHPGVPRKVDATALDLYLTFRFVPAPWTILQGVHKLPPGCVLTWHEGRTTLQRYWDLPEPGHVETKLGSPGAADCVETLLADSVRSRLVSDVPLGAYLSGGLDSSLVVAMMARAASRPVTTFSVGFRESGFDESRHALKVSRRFGTEHHRLTAECGASVGELPRIIWHLDEPVADAAAIPTFQMARLTKEHVTVVLTGEGADELFAGYPHYRFLVGTDALRQYVWPCAAAAPWSRVGEYFGAIGDRVGAYLALKSVFTAPERRALLRPEIAGQVQDGVARDLVAQHIESRAGADYLDQLLRLDLKLWLPDNLLVKVDRMTMAHAVEARVPYLDHRLVELMVALPSSLKLRALRSKFLLRQVGERILPRSTARRRKKGFTVPVSRWVRRTRLVEHLLNRENVEQRGLFRPEAVSPFLRGAGRTLYSRRQLWALVALELWCRTMLDGDATRPPDTDEGSGG